jgi:hypothetical protein
MSLVPYTITALELNQADATASGKQVVVGASCSMFIQPADTAVLLYDDAAASNGSTAKTTGTNGQVTVYVEPAEYRIVANGISRFLQVGIDNEITTTQLIASTRVYPANTIIKSIGFNNVFDNGQAQWVQNGTTGQTPSQSPAQLGGGILNDGNGVQWGLIDEGKISTLKLGALENGVFDDYLVLLAAVNYAESVRGVVAGGTVWITNHLLIGTPIVLPQGIYLQGVFRPISLLNQVGAPAFPSSFNEASQILGSHTAGPVIWQKNSSCGVVDLTVGATQARQQAAITTGPGNTNCGILTETEDTSNAIMLYPRVKNVVIRNQPADGHYTNGNVAGYDYTDVTAINVGRHGSAGEDGQLSGRTNKYRPGLGVLNNPRACNTGGHGLAWGHPDSGVNIPYRVEINNYEGIRHGNTPSLLYVSAGAYVVAEQVLINTSASAGTSGTSGDTPTLDHAFAVAGRQIILSACRYIRCIAEHLSVLDHTGVTNDYVSVNGGHGSTTTGSPSYFVKVAGTTNALVIRGLTGNYVNAVNLSTITGTADIEDDGERVFYNTILNKTVLNDPISNNHSSMQIAIADNAAVAIDFTTGVSSSNARGVVVICGSTGTRGAAQIHFRVGTSEFCTIMSSSGTVTAGTAALSGSTGSNASLNIAAVSDGKLYIENRTGGDTAYMVTFMSLDPEDGLPITP